MVQRKVTIQDPIGIHLRPAGTICQIALNFPCKVTIKVREFEVNGKSVLGILSAGIKFGEEIEVICDGEKEQEALDALEAELIKEFV